MPYRHTHFVTGNFYHIYNRGVEKRNIFLEDKDYQRFLEIIYFYQFSGPKPSFSQYKRFKIVDFAQNPRIVDINCYCLMPNHFHMLLKQNINGGVQEFVRKVSDSYTKYFNTKYQRVGPLLQGVFKDVYVNSDEQLVHVSRYIHLNPFVSGLTHNLSTYSFSSYNEYINPASSSLCNTKIVLDFFKKNGEYERFVNDHANYAKSIKEIEVTLIDNEE